MKKIIEAIQKRRAVREYVAKPVEEEKIEAILKAAKFAPSARNTRVYELVVVQDGEIVRKLGEMKPHSIHVGKAPVVIVVCSQEFEQWLEDASIIAEHVWLEAVNQGLASCWTQVRGSETNSGQDAEAYVREILKIPAGIRILCLMPIGYPERELPAHTEKDFETWKIHKNKW